MPCGIFAFQPYLSKICPQFLQKVLGNSKIVSSFSEEERKCIQNIVDFLIYNGGSVAGNLEVLFILNRVVNELALIKKDTISTLINQINLENVLDVLERTEKYLLRDSECHEEATPSSSPLSQFREYCLDFIGTQALENPKEYEDIENDKRLDKYFRTLMKRKSIGKVDLGEATSDVTYYPLGELINDKSGDVQLNVNGVIIKCHKTILATKSIYFDSLFNGSWSNVNTESEIYPEEILHIVRYCYNIEETIPTGLIIRVIKKAHEHEMLEFVQIVSKQLVITVGNFFEITTSLFEDIELEMFSSLRQDLTNFGFINRKNLNFNKETLKQLPEVMREDIFLQLLNQ